MTAAPSPGSHLSNVWSKMTDLQATAPELLRLHYFLRFAKIEPEAAEAAR